MAYEASGMLWSKIKGSFSLLRFLPQASHSFCVDASAFEDQDVVDRFLWQKGLLDLVVFAVFTCTAVQQNLSFSRDFCKFSNSALSPWPDILSANLVGLYCPPVHYNLPLLLQSAKSRNFFSSIFLPLFLYLFAFFTPSTTIVVKCFCVSCNFKHLEQCFARKNKEYRTDGRRLCLCLCLFLLSLCLFFLCVCVCT